MGDNERGGHVGARWNPGRMFTPGGAEVTIRAVEGGPLEVKVTHDPQEIRGKEQPEESKERHSVTFIGCEFVADSTAPAPEERLDDLSLTERVHMTLISDDPAGPVRYNVGDGVACVDRWSPVFGRTGVVTGVGRGVPWAEAQPGVSDWLYNVRFDHSPVTVWLSQHWIESAQSSNADIMAATLFDADVND